MCDGVSNSNHTATQGCTEIPSTIPDQAQIAAEFGGDSAAQLAAMLFLFSRERRRDSAEQRDQIEGQIREHQETQILNLHKGADAAYDAAIWESSAQLIGGALSLAGAGATSDGGEWGAAINATSGYMQGSMNMIAASDNLDAANRAADAEHASNQAGSFERSLDTVNSDAEDAKAMKDAVYDFLQEVQKTKAEGDKTLVSIRV